MSSLHTVGYRMDKHLRKWSVSLDDDQVDRLIDQLHALCATAAAFPETHYQGDAFYAEAYATWCKQYTPKIKEVLSKLYYHGYIVSYTVRGLKITFRMADSWGQTVYQNMVERLSKVFQTDNTNYLREPVARNPRQDRRQAISDGFSIRTQMPASPQMFKSDGYTDQHFKKLLATNGNSTQAHYMYLKLQGATFQFEISKPSESYLSSIKSEKEKVKTKLTMIINKWR